jgi:plastocyanin
MNIMRTARIALTTVAVTTLLAGCYKNSSYSTMPSLSTQPLPSPQPNSVVIGNFAFDPATLTVGKNVSVTFTNYDGVTHTAVGDDGSWNTGSIASEGSKSLTFATAGTYPYHCSVHPTMKGTIVVQ